MVNVTMKTGLFLLLGSVVAIIFGFVFLNGAINGFTESAESTDCNKLPWFDSLINPPECSSDGDWGIGSLCCGIIFILIGFGVAISAVVTLITGMASDNRQVIIIQQQDD
ncbi:MAG: hypothetical protein ACKVJ7_00365 [Candidatus Poseidoniales archaeon]